MGLYNNIETYCDINLNSILNISSPLEHYIFKKNYLTFKLAFKISSRNVFVMSLVIISIQVMGLRNNSVLTFISEAFHYYAGKFESYNCTQDTNMPFYC